MKDVHCWYCGAPVNHGFCPRCGVAEPPRDLARELYDTATKAGITCSPEALSWMQTASERRAHVPTINLEFKPGAFALLTPEQAQRKRDTRRGFICLAVAIAAGIVIGALIF
jgi:hypothetical protein